MCFCPSGCMIDWWTHRSSLAFSFTALNPIFSGCFRDFPCIFLLGSLWRWSKSVFFFFSPLSLSWIFCFLYLGFFLLFAFLFPAWLPALLCAHRPFLFPPAVLFLFLPSSSVPRVLVCGFWAMLSSPTVILQPYGLPVYPQATTCYPSIVQVNLLFYALKASVGKL